MERIGHKASSRFVFSIGPVRKNRRSGSRANQVDYDRRGRKGERKSPKGVRENRRERGLSRKEGRKKGRRGKRRPKKQSGETKRGPAVR